MLEVRIIEVSVTRMGFAIVLQPLSRDKVVPIFIGPLETYSISSALEGQKSERPLTHDLMKNLIENLKYSLERIVVNKFKGGTFFARMHLKGAGGEGEIIELDLDSRPSDAIALAIRFDCPIYLEEDVYDKVAVDPSVLKEKKVDTSEEAITIVGNDDELIESSEEMIQAIMEEFNEPPAQYENSRDERRKSSGVESYKTKEQVLEKMLEVAVLRENYEEAARLRDELSEIREEFEYPYTSKKKVTPKPQKAGGSPSAKSSSKPAKGTKSNKSKDQPES